MFGLKTKEPAVEGPDSHVAVRSGTVCASVPGFQNAMGLATATSPHGVTLADLAAKRQIQMC